MPRALDTLALLGISGVLLVAFYYQFGLGELPCPLCALQRVGFIVAGVGLLLNLRSGYSPAHYGLVLLTSVVAGAASLRQISLHVIPGSGSYGSALFGFHFYTWAFVGYGALVAYTGVALLLEGGRPVRDIVHDVSRGRGVVATLACWLFVAMAAANVLAF
ncbi:MAG: disulfide bond formation protein B, partial [Betaproteobacteria bacterium]